MTGDARLDWEAIKTHLVTAGLTAIAGGTWRLVRKIAKLVQDLNAAHQLIRELRTRVVALEELWASEKKIAPPMDANTPGNPRRSGRR